MPDYTLSIAISGDLLLTRHVATAKASISDFRPLWKAVEERFIEMEKQQFGSEGRGEWPGLAPSTVKKRGSAHPILQVTGDLFRSLTRGGKGYLAVSTPYSIVLGTELMTKGGKWNLGLLHQMGTGRSEGVGKSGKALKHPKVSFRMPPRPPIDPGWVDRIYIRSLFSAYIHQIVTGEKGPAPAV